MDHHHRLILLLIALLISSLFLFSPSVKAVDLDKLLGQKYYLHRDIAFGSYLKLNPSPPTDSGKYVVSKLCSVGLNDLPYSWITPEAPRDYTCPLNYCFKFVVYANCSATAWGVFIASFWRLRNGTETKLITLNPSSQQINYEPMTGITWFQWINASLSIKQGDRLIFRLKVYAGAAGRFYMGLDCLSYPSHLLDPSTEILRPNADGTDYLAEWPSGSSIPPPHYDKVDEVTSDGDTTWIETSEDLTPRINRFLYPDSSLASASWLVIDSVTVYGQAKRTWDNPSYETQPAFYVGLYNTTASAQYFGSLNYLTDNYVNYSKSWTTNPSTSGAWTVAQINGCEISNKGISNRVYKIGVYWYSFARDTQTWLVVEYHIVVLYFTMIDNLYVYLSSSQTRSTTSIKGSGVDLSLALQRTLHILADSFLGSAADPSVSAQRTGHYLSDSFYGSTDPSGESSWESSYGFLSGDAVNPIVVLEARIEEIVAEFFFDLSVLLNPIPVLEVYGFPPAVTPFPVFTWIIMPAFLSCIVGLLLIGSLKRRRKRISVEEDQDND